MKLKKEPKDVDFLIKSESWSEKDLADFRKLMQEIKRKNKLKNASVLNTVAKIKQTRKIA